MTPVPTGGTDVAGTIARYAPRSRPAEVGGFARHVVAAAEPQTPERAKALLFAASKLATFALSVGLDLGPEVVLCPSVIERFIVVEHGALSGATARTVRSNLRFLANAVLVHPPPPPVPLSRERSKAPYSEAEIGAYLALADAQPTPERRLRLSGLVSLGAGAGLMGADLRAVKGTDVARRSGGVLVRVAGKRPRVVPVLSRYHERVLAAADAAGTTFLIGGYSASRRNVTSGLVASVASGADRPGLDVSRLRATWLVSCAKAIGLKDFMDAAGIVCTQRLGDLVATVDPMEEGAAVALLGEAH